MKEKKNKSPEILVRMKGFRGEEAKHKTCKKKKTFCNQQLQIEDDNQFDAFVH